MSITPKQPTKQMYKVLQQKLWCPPRLLAKLLLIMKLTTIILITAILQVSASSFAQKISLSEKNASLTAVLDRISTQTGYDFFYKSINTKNLKTISIEVENLELKDVLKRILEPQNLDFEIDDSSLIIKVKQSASSEKQLSQSKEIDVKGRVVDKNGKPLVGATVKVKGSSLVATTDSKGEFSLFKIKDNVILTISFIGYLTTSDCDLGISGSH
ncbi:MAG: SusC/RagA family TonB-linked outer membrane protein [Pedobacter sp.]|nr:MAG: SusC/RagA family TonB-linked outer membrane protein [Pedobacter sp.]